jgi:hypothetical protein
MRYYHYCIIQYVYCDFKMLQVYSVETEPRPRQWGPETEPRH